MQGAPQPGRNSGAGRTLGWIMKARRNVRDYERLPQHSEAHLTWALITLMTRRITRSGPRKDWSKRDSPA
jgi:hypothetical protein